MPPSRQFLVQQSVLTALHKLYPYTIEMYGRPKAARRAMLLVADQFKEGDDFCAYVRAEYRALANLHGVA